jgi:hypothetical protein
VSLARIPSLSILLPICTPRSAVGTITSVLFACGAPSLVLTSRHSQSACAAFVIHIFEPLIT